MAELSEEQTLAAYAPGSVAITAGAGAGKTSTLAARYVAHIAKGKLTSPLEVVAVTFTDKAADELRARIRKEFKEEFKKCSDGRITEEVIAEVEAAQISTIHALAARICRDFYDVAGLAPDFRVMDASESELWIVEKIEEALADIPRETVEALTYKVLLPAMHTLITDPHVAQRALSKGIPEWTEAMRVFRVQVIEELVGGDLFKKTREVLETFSGEDGDKREELRREVLDLMSKLERNEDPLPSLEELSKVTLRGGSANKWPSGGFEEVKDAITAIREVVKEVKELALLDIGVADHELARQVELLRQAFDQVSKFIDERKKDEGLLDFNDLEIHATTILSRSEVRAHYRERWKAVMVDEFQDTNTAQAEIIRMLTEGGATTLTIVGDKKQGIYGFRGAEVEIFDQFVEEIEASGSGSAMNLSTSYRSHSGLVELTNKIFKPVLKRHFEALVAARPTSPIGGPYVELQMVDAGEKEFPASERLNVEAVSIAERIRTIVDSNEMVIDKDTRKERPIRYDDIAVLCRAWAPLEVIADALSAQRIPVAFSGSKGLLETREAQDVVALLAFLANPKDDIALIAVLRSVFFGISDVELFEYSKTFSKDERWWDAIAKSPGILMRAANVLKELLDMRAASTASALALRADELTGYSAVLANLPHGARREADWRGMLGLLGELAGQGKDDVFSASRAIKRLIEFEVEWPRLPVDSGNAVQLTTIHGAKGLEWSVVFVPSLTRKSGNKTLPIKVDAELGVAFTLGEMDGEEVVPSIYTLIKHAQERRDADERKRVVYVALTRAREKVILSASSRPEAMDLKVLWPGIENAEIAQTLVPFTLENALPPEPGAPDEFPEPSNVQTEAIPPVIRTLGITGLSEYLKCPKLFRYKHVDGHPGLGEGSADSRIIGILTHRALERDMSDSKALRDTEAGATMKQAEDAIQFAKKFRTHKAFADVRDSIIDKELDLSLEVGGLLLTGVADAVGDDFVLDYKTEKDMKPEHHKLQLWAYTKALGKSEGHLAYLRHDELHTFSAEDLHGLDEVAEKTAKAITEGRFAANPSKDACRFCSYGDICTEKAVD